MAQKINCKDCKHKKENEYEGIWCDLLNVELTNEEVEDYYSKNCEK